MNEKRRPWINGEERRRKMNHEESADRIFPSVVDDEMRMPKNSLLGYEVVIIF